MFAQIAAISSITSPNSNTMHIYIYNLKFKCQTEWNVLCGHPIVIYYSLTAMNQLYVVAIALSSYNNIISAGNTIATVNRSYRSNPTINRATEY